MASSLEENALAQQQLMEEQEQDTDDRDTLTDQEEQDLHIGWLLAEQLLEDGGIDVVLQAMDNSGNPAQVIGQFIAQLIMQIGEAMTGEDALSPKIYFSENGLVEIIGDYLEDEGIPEDVVGNAEVVCLSIMQSVAQGNQKGMAPQGAPAPGGMSQPMMPQQGGMV
ncbi:hypothetical protein [Xanthomonas phage DES1]|nr:hypothetical protein [Xanthomonas phage DES1]